MKRLSLILCLALLVIGCTRFAKRTDRTAAKASANQIAIAEESKALTTGIVDVLSLAPTNPPTALALDLARHDQQLEGLPVTRIPIEALLARQEREWKALRERYDLQASLLAERQEIATRLAETEAALIEMGRKYEAERNKSIVRRIWAWSISTLGIGGLIALCIFFPAVIPLFGNLLGFVVNRIPKLAGALGVVSKKAFDSAVKGVGEFRHALKVRGETETLKELDTELLKATGEVRPVIEARRVALNV